MLKLYERVSGYDPFTGANDNGAVEPDVLEQWRTAGHGPMRHKIAAWVGVDHTNVEAVRQTIDVFGFAYVGLNVPQAWLSGPDVWDVSSSPIAGGHAVILVGYDATGFYLVSWGRVYRLTYAAWAQYGEESYACIANEWLSPGGPTPGGLPLADLQSDLNALRSAV